MKNKILKKLDIDLYGQYEGQTLEERYNKERADFISESQRYVKGYSTGFFGWRDGYYEKTPETGKIEWEQRYPNGIDDWAQSATNLTSYGQQQVINKVNEIIEYINSQDKYEKKETKRTKTH